MGGNSTSFVIQAFRRYYVTQGTKFETCGRESGTRPYNSEKIQKLSKLMNYGVLKWNETHEPDEEATKCPLTVRWIIQWKAGGKKWW